MGQYSQPRPSGGSKAGGGVGRSPFRGSTRWCVVGGVVLISDVPEVRSLSEIAPILSAVQRWSGHVAVSARCESGETGHESVGGHEPGPDVLVLQLEEL